MRMFYSLFMVEMFSAFLSLFLFLHVGSLYSPPPLSLSLSLRHKYVDIDEKDPDTDLSEDVLNCMSITERLNYIGACIRACLRTNTNVSGGAATFKRFHGTALKTSKNEHIPEEIPNGLESSILNFRCSSCEDSKRKLLVVLNKVSKLLKGDDDKEENDNDVDGVRKKTKKKNVKNIDVKQVKKIKCLISKYSRISLPNLVRHFVDHYDTKDEIVLQAFIATSGHIRGTCNYLSNFCFGKDCDHCIGAARDVPIWRRQDDRILLTSGHLSKEEKILLQKQINDIIARYGTPGVVASRMDFLESL